MPPKQKSPSNYLSWLGDAMSRLDDVFVHAGLGPAEIDRIADQIDDTDDGEISIRICVKREQSDEGGTIVGSTTPITSMKRGLLTRFHGFHVMPLAA